MKVDAIRYDVIKPKLVDMLGRTMAEDIFRKAEYATVAASDDFEILRIFVDKTCSDPRFVGLWGTAQAEKQKLEWMDLFK